GARPGPRTDPAAGVRGGRCQPGDPPSRRRQGIRAGPRRGPPRRAADRLRPRPGPDPPAHRPRLGAGVPRRLPGQPGHGAGPPQRRTDAAPTGLGGQVPGHGHPERTSGLPGRHLPPAARGPAVTPPVIAVIEPVEPALLTAWTNHYRRIGVDRFLIAFHFPEQVYPRHRDTLLGTAADLGIGPALTSTGPWHEHTNTELRERLRTLA